MSLYLSILMYQFMLEVISEQSYLLRSIKAERYGNIMRPFLIMAGHRFDF